MPRSLKEWLRLAEEMEAGLKAYGHVVMRVHIDPKTFPDWCASHDTSPGSEGRKRFVAAAVTERYGRSELTSGVQVEHSRIPQPDSASARGLMMGSQSVSTRSSGCERVE